MNFDSRLCFVLSSKREMSSLMTKLKRKKKSQTRFWACGRRSSVPLRRLPAESPNYLCSLRLSQQWKLKNKEPHRNTFAWITKTETHILEQHNNSLQTLVLQCHVKVFLKQHKGPLSLSVSFEVRFAYFEEASFSCCGLSSLLATATTAYHFSALCHTSTAMKLANYSEHLGRRD